MSKKIHIAIASTTSKPGDVKGNLRQITSFALRAAADGAALLLTPEMSASGYGPYPENIATAEPAGDGPIYRELAAMAKATGVVICAGFVEAAGPKRYLCHYVVRPDGNFVVQRKHKVTYAEKPLDSPVVCVRRGDETDPADPGQPQEIHFNYFSIRDVRCAVAICADSGIIGLQDELDSNGVELLLLPTGAGGRREDRVTTEDLRTAEGREKYLNVLQGVFFPGRGIINCIERGRAMAAVNLCGYDGREKYHVGHGMIITPMGEVPGFFHGLPNLDRQRPLYAHAVVDVEERVKG